MKLISALSLFMLFAFTACTNAQTEQEAPATEQAAPAPQEVANPYSDLDVADFRGKMDDPNVVIVDVRTPQETAQGMIEGALEANVNDKEAFTDFLSGLDKDKTYLVYCRSGRRSARACKIMAKEGFTDLYNLAGGFLAWEAEPEN